MSKEQYTGFDRFKDISYETDKKLKEHNQTRGVMPEVKYIVRHTPAHKPGVRTGKR